MEIINSTNTHKCREEDEISEENKREMEIFSQFENKRVRIKTMEANYEMIGRVKRNPENEKKFVFFEGRKINCYSYLTLGFATGCYATLTITEINKCL